MKVQTGTHHRGERTRASVRTPFDLYFHDDKTPVIKTEHRGLWGGKAYTKGRILNLKMTLINLRWKWQNKIHYETCTFVHSVTHKQVQNGGSITSMPPCSGTPKGIPGNQTAAITHLTSEGMVLSQTYIDRILSRQETKFTLFLMVQNPAGRWNERAAVHWAEIWRQTRKQNFLISEKKYVCTEQKIFKNRVKEN